MKKVILIVLAILAVGFVAIKGKQYYDNTYIGKDYYLQIPADQSTKMDTWESGGFTIKGKRYEYTAYNEQGETNLAFFSVTDDEDRNITEKNLLKPNTYIKVNASKARTLTWRIVQEGDVPPAALEYIKQNRK
ncbi:YxeA family protein [Treponema sp. R6D11]